MLNIRSKKGATLTEYAALVGLIGVLAVSSVFGIGDEVKGQFKSVDNEITDRIVLAATNSKLPSQVNIVEENIEDDTVNWNIHTLINQTPTSTSMTEITLDTTQLVGEWIINPYENGDLYVGQQDEYTVYVTNFSSFDVVRVLLSEDYNFWALILDDAGYEVYVDGVLYE